MTTCEACGKEDPQGNIFCTSCGARLPGTDAAEQAGCSGVPRREPEDLVAWERKIPLITNPYLVLQCIAAPMGIGLFGGLFFWLITGEQTMLWMFLVLGFFLMLIFLFVMVVLQVFTGGGLLTSFFISSEGVAHKAGSTTSSLNRAATAGSVLMGSMGGTGAGLIAMSQECNVLEWEDVRYISVYPRVRSVVFRSQWLISPVVLYCTEENFSRVLGMVKQYAPAVATRNLKP